jgi:hypothetical protein
MRMWMVDPSIMCRKHLLGEHVECHMFLGCMIKNISLNGYIENNLFEVLSLFTRHAELSMEMENRNYKHKSPLSLGIYLSHYKKYQNVIIDREQSLMDLLNRCPECRERKEKKNAKA